VSLRRFPPYVELGPERLFGVHEVGGDALVRGHMTTGTWNRDGPCRSSAGSLGVLIDDVLGFGVAARTPDGWSTVTTNIHADFFSVVPCDGSALTAEVMSLDTNGDGGLATGVVFDESGRVLVRASLRGRFIPESPGTGAAGERVLSAAEVTDVCSAIGGTVGRVPGGADLELTVGADLVNIRDNLHGGITLCAAEISASACCNERCDADFVTTAVDITYLRPAPIGRSLRFEARTAHPGRQTRHTQVLATGLRGKPVAIASVSAHRAG
jgi:uncharacterized protein (TIGR00369 family)